MKAWFQLFIRLKDTGSLKGHLARGMVGTLSLIVANTVLAFVLNVFLARLLGTTEYGIYAYVMVWLNLLVIPAAFGLDKLLIRSVSTYQTASTWGHLHGLLRWADRVVLLCSLGLALVSTLIVWLSTAPSDKKILTTFVIGLMSLPLSALMLLRQATLQGIHQVLQGQLPERLIRPAIIIILVGGIYLYQNKSLNAMAAIAAVVIASGIAFLSGEWFVYRTFPRAIKQAVPIYQSRVWGLSALPIMLTLSMYVINDQLNLILLGMIKGMGAVGFYTVANQAGKLINFILVAVNIALGPIIASLYAKQEMRELQRILTMSVRMLLFLALPVALLLAFFGHWFLLLFGQDFTQGQTALVILSVGQLVNCAMGPVGLLLLMTGYERDVVAGMGLSLTLNFILSAILIPAWGIEGAALASALAMITWNLLLARRVHQRLGLQTSILSAKWARASVDV